MAKINANNLQDAIAKFDDLKAKFTPPDNSIITFAYNGKQRIVRIVHTKPTYWHTVELQNGEENECFKNFSINKLESGWEYVTAK